jgi:hypothetical protein
MLSAGWLQRRLGRASWLGLWGSVLVGCPAAQAPQQATTFAAATKRPELSCRREGAERVDVASWRGSGRPDVARVFTRTAGSSGQAQVVLSCREVDLNSDGHKDMLVYYDAEGRKLREEIDHDHDGVADVQGFYEQGRLVRQELDTNSDGKADLVQHFENGRLQRVEKLDSTGPFASDPKAAAPPAAIAPSSSAPAAPVESKASLPPPPAATSSP